MSSASATAPVLDDAVKAAFSGGISAAVPKDVAAAFSDTKESSSRPKPVKQYSVPAGVQAYLNKSEDNDREEGAGTSDAVKAAMSGGIAKAASKDAPSKAKPKMTKAYSVPKGIQAYLDKAEEKERNDDEADDDDDNSAVRAAMSGGIARAVATRDAPSATASAASVSAGTFGGSGHSRLKSSPEKGSGHSRPKMAKEYSVPAGVQAYLDRADDNKDDDQEGAGGADDDAVKAAMSGGLAKGVATKEASSSSVSAGGGSGHSRPKMSKAYSVPAGVQAYLDKAEAEDEALVNNDDDDNDAVKAAMSGGIASAVHKVEQKSSVGGGSGHSRPKTTTKEYSVPAGVQAYLDKAEDNDDQEDGGTSEAVKAAMSGGLASAVHKVEQNSSVGWSGHSRAAKDSSPSPSKKQPKEYHVPAGIQAYLDKSDAEQEASSDAVKAAVSGGLAAAVAKETSSPATKREPKEVPPEVRKWLEESFDEQEARAVVRAASTGTSVAASLKAVGKSTGKNRAYAAPITPTKATSPGEQAVSPEEVKMAVAGGIAAAVSSRNLGTSSAHSRSISSPKSAAEAAAAKLNSPSSPASGKKSTTAKSPTVEKELVEKLGITWASARELASWSKGFLDVDLGDAEAEKANRAEIIQLATDEYERHPQRYQRNPSGKSSSSRPTVRKKKSSSAAVAPEEKKDSSSSPTKSSGGEKDAGAAVVETAAASDPAAAAASDPVAPTTSSTEMPPSSSEHSARKLSMGTGEQHQPSIEKELCETLDVTWAGARELVIWSKGCLKMGPDDGAAEKVHRQEILDLAREENERHPRPSRPKSPAKKSGAGTEESSATAEPKKKGRRRSVMGDLKAASRRVLGKSTKKGGGGGSKHRREAASAAESSQEGAPSSQHSRAPEPPIERELCERLDITRAGALDLVAYAKNSLKIDPENALAEREHRLLILELAAEENERHPRPSRPKEIKTTSEAFVSSKKEQAEKKKEGAKAKEPTSSSASPKSQGGYSVPAGIQAYLDKADDDEKEGETTSEAVKAAVSGGLASAVHKAEGPSSVSAGGSGHSRPKMTKAYSVPAGVQAYLDKAEDDDGEQASGTVKAAMSGGIAAAAAPKPKADASSSVSAGGSGHSRKAYSVPAGVQAYLDKAPDDDEGETSGAVKAAMSGGIAAAAPRPTTPAQSSRPKPVKQYSVPAGVQAYLNRVTEAEKEAAASANEEAQQGIGTIKATSDRPEGPLTPSTVNTSVDSY